MIALERSRVFRQLHQSGCFVIPNPWDLGSARLLAQLGFPALATTSSGFAWSLGRRDNGVTLGQALAHLRSIAHGVEVPVNGDFEGGFAVAPEQVAANVTAATATGVAGLSIEDSTGDTSSPLFDFQLSVERIRAARQAIDESGTGIVLTGRSEGFIVGRPDLAETIRRLTAYSDAGADCLYAPGLRTRAEIVAVVAGGRSQAGQRAGRKRFCHRRRARRDGGAPDQRGWRAGPRGLDRVPPGREGDRRAGHLSRSGSGGVLCRHQRVIQLTALALANPGFRFHFLLITDRPTSLTRRTPCRTSPGLASRRAWSWQLPANLVPGPRPRMAGGAGRRRGRPVRPGQGEHTRGGRGVGQRGQGG